MSAQRAPARSQDGVGSDRGRVHDLRGALGRDIEIRERRPRPGNHALGIILRRRQNLADRETARFRRYHDIGKRAADIDAKPVGLGFLGLCHASPTTGASPQHPMLSSRRAHLVTSLFLASGVQGGAGRGPLDRARPATRQPRARYRLLGQPRARPTLRRRPDRALVDRGGVAGRILAASVCSAGVTRKPRSSSGRLTRLSRHAGAAAPARRAPRSRSRRVR